MKKTHKKARLRSHIDQVTLHHITLQKQCNIKETHKKSRLRSHTDHAMLHHITLQNKRNTKETQSQTGPATLHHAKNKKKFTECNIKEM